MADQKMYVSNQSIVSKIPAISQTLYISYKKYQYIFADSLPTTSSVGILLSLAENVRDRHMYVYVCVNDALEVERIVTREVA